jgi:MFS family permease
MAIAEIPSGMIADSIGRKKVLIFSKVAIIFGMLLLLITKSFIGAIIVAVIYGIFGAMESGVIGSSLYELFNRNGLTMVMYEIQRQVEIT